ncbi:MAG: hypothetical protein DCC58_01275 [Chloroflexi bacterium]|nr:MAG: hypothetical protein DCC58_01275 [Chloroflexota bacterium]
MCNATIGEPSMSNSGGWRLLLLLYPRTWQQQFGAAFLALLRERPPGVRDMVDILSGAAAAHLRPRAWQLERQLLFEAAGPSSFSSAPASGPSPDPPRDQDEQRRFTRRTFLRNAVLGGAAVTAVGITGGTLIFLRPDDDEETGVGVVTVPAAELPAEGAAPLTHDDGKFHLIRNSDGYLAMSWRCTHLHCTVPWNDREDHFRCPCHGSVYDRYGARLSGPAPRPLDLLALSFDASGNAVVDTDIIQQRETFEPAQVVPPPG